VPITITAHASGSLTPPTGTYPNAITNGDFTITGNPGAVAVGEGVDEETRWIFNFNPDPAFAFFTPSQGLSSAMLTLTLTPRDTLITTDAVRIDSPGFANITGPIQALPVNVTSTIQIDLLAQPTYSAVAILAALASGSGKISMVYADDSIVTSATLELTQNTPAYQYAVKFVCGKSEGRVVAPGTYHTAINVHNPAYKTIRFRKKFAVGLPSEKSGPVTGFFNTKLGPDRALEIDTDDILQHLNATPAPAPFSFAKGFAILESDVELDVVAVYTVTDTQGRAVAFHTERVLARKSSCCCKDQPPSGQPDLIPVPLPSGSFCNATPQGLVVTVKNQGTGSAGASITRVTFSNGSTVDIPTPALAAGAQVNLPPVPFPPNCFQPDCSFRITVDATGLVAESNEANNSASGTCIG
jgi:CARDB protein